MSKPNVAGAIWLPVLLLAARLGFSQAPPKETPPKEETFTVKGYSSQAAVLQLNGKSYVEIEALARLTSGSISFQGSQVTLTLPAPAVKASLPPADQSAKQMFSKEFLRAAIEELAVIREWRIAIVNAIRTNYPITDDWVGSYGRNAESKLALASAGAATDADRDFLSLLNNEFNSMKGMSDKYLEMHKSLSYIAPDSLDTDAQDQQVLNCARGLAFLATGSRFEDVAVCH
jgi:hypothetical protein